ncbi:flavin-containing monooxygenase [Solimonas marina]|uniref:NAD(P)-binding domain-containing protein n=1 Tax=Solimonas marina TaxID=2714601 RepID=A0A969WB91_9GAMM|nr:NAD(P)-binding domain-containing protein [Solimonas marina]NKF23339.1 NAD(P)-binding domain-containing protein [Solimonas marina]
MSAGQRVAVIGAGPSGIAAAKECLAHGLGDGLVVFEKSDQVGGNWVFREQTGHSSVYETTHIISSKYYSEYEDFPFPAGVPDYPHHTHLKAYFQDYAQHFGVLDKIRFHTEVLRAERDADGKWQLHSRGPDGERIETFDALMVANGHHWNPRLPSYPGRFDGEFLHSHQFKRGETFRGKRVLVIGGGNSAADVAVECARVCPQVSISMRRGHWFLPKFMFGLPGDVIYERAAWLPNVLRQWGLQLSVKIVGGDNTRFGLQKPAYKILQGHPTLNSELLYFIGHGEIQPRPGVARFEGGRVYFSDGTHGEFDTIVAATGYKITFPFFDPSFIDWQDATYVPLWRRMFHEQVPNLYFIGLFQPIGCIWPLADYQAMLACLDIVGRYRRPSDMAAAIAAERRRPHFRFVESPRHSTEVDYADFRHELFAELKKAGAQPHPRPRSASIFRLRDEASAMKRMRAA